MGQAAGRREVRGGGGRAQSPSQHSPVSHQLPLTQDGLVVIPEFVRVMMMAAIYKCLLCARCNMGC
jgi:hypothetical protein